jgi:hypothetical protein
MGEGRVGLEEIGTADGARQREGFYQTVSRRYQLFTNGLAFGMLGPKNCMNHRRVGIACLVWKDI